MRDSETFLNNNYQQSVSWDYSLRSSYPAPQVKVKKKSSCKNFKCSVMFRSQNLAKLRSWTVSLATRRPRLLRPLPRLLPQSSSCLSPRRRSRRIATSWAVSRRTRRTCSGAARGFLSHGSQKAPTGGAWEGGKDAIGWYWNQSHSDADVISKFSMLYSKFTTAKTPMK